ncbi:unnamed protein product [Pseudo-nitzschia multistriata]|uniref:Uncharacterized protein n=1 Tax=Pseudo-nitzschia multistriata TaxID=183589 RepID=A0A448Z2V8_9STRA|nr:unnamed protein product [Pseudo-nitzschia multistriata]
MLLKSLGRCRAPRTLLQPPSTTTASVFGGGSRRSVPVADGRTRRICPAQRGMSYSRMLDMGGAPSAKSDQSLIRTVNASKNSKLQAVAFDFKVLINTTTNDANANIDGNPKENGAAAPEWSRTDRSTTRQSPPPLPPPPTTPPTGEPSATANFIDTDRIKQVASLLNVKLGSSPEETDPVPTKKAPPKPKDYDPSAADIRAKYASKLKGGLAGIELAKSQVSETLTKGDAAGHLAARKIALMGDNTAAGATGGGSKKWLPSQAATQLLTLLTHRSIRVCLLPILSAGPGGADGSGEEPRMEDFGAQLKNVVIDNMVPSLGSGGDGEDNEDGIENALRKGVLDELDLDPNRVLLVSDRDAYLRAGRDMGMNICRIRARNARRGNITAQYTIESVEEVRDVVNEINGISFNVVLNR